LGDQFLALGPLAAMKRPYGTGHIYESSGAYYRRWHTPDGRRRNRRLGPKRAPGSSVGLTRAMAERTLRKAQEAEFAAVVRANNGRGRTVDDAANALRERLRAPGRAKVLPAELRVDAARPHLAGHGLAQSRRGHEHRRRGARCCGEVSRRIRP
jgi:hypothetical protein